MTKAAPRLGVLAQLGWPLEASYSGAMALRRWLYLNGHRPRATLPGKTISIGNLEVGGTGKSPVVIRIAQYLKARGAKPAILTRGYRSGLAADDSAALIGTRVLLSSRVGSSFHADEAQMQAAILGDVPVVIGANRVAAAHRFLETAAGPTHWLLDDGFQHLRLTRDLDLVLLDAESPFANGHLLPLGRLREGPDALARADAVIFTRASEGAPKAPATELINAMGLRSLKAPFVSGDLQLVAGRPSGQSKPRRVAAITAIARPERFVASLRERGLEVAELITRRDHERFAKDELAGLSPQLDGLVTTEKDYWRDRTVFEEVKLPTYVLPLTAQLGDADLDALLAPVLRHTRVDT